MSATTSEKIPSSSSATSTRPWYVVSIILHAIALGVVLWVGPVRTIVLQEKSKEPPKAELTATAERIEEIVEQVRDREEDLNRLKVEELLDIQEQVEQMAAQKMDQYAQASQDMAADAPERAMEAAKAVEEASVKVEAALKVVDADLEKVAAAEADVRKKAQAKDPALNEAVDALRAAQDQTVKDQDAAKTAMIEMIASQEHLAAIAAVGGEALADATKAQKDAVDAANKLAVDQGDAKDLERKAERSAESAGKADKSSQGADKRSEQLADTAKNAADDARKAQEKADASKAQAEQARQEAVDASAKASAAKSQADQAAKAAKAASAKAAKSKSPADAKAAEQATTQAAEASKASQATGEVAKDKSAQARKAADAAKADATSARNARSKADRATADANKAAASAANAQEARAKALDAVETTQKTAREAQADVRKAFDTARAAQVKANAALAAAKDIATSQPALAASQPAEATTQATEATASTERPNLDGQNLADLYDAAVKAEQDIAEAYKKMRAADLAMISRVPMETALKRTDVTKPVRPGIDRSLLTSSIRTAEAADANKKETAKVADELDSMVTANKRILEQAVGAGADAKAIGLVASAEDIRARSEHNEAMRNAAAESGERAKDLTALMKGEGADAKTSQDGKASADGKESHAGRPGGSASKGGVPSYSGSRGDAGFPAIGKQIVAMPTRKVGATGMPAEWVYVDSWWIIGPFDNPNRINIDKEFPPEQVIDLDATYAGKGERQLRWKYAKSPTVSVVPLDSAEYSIYYAYTELWFDDERDMWIAVGSDDNSRVWINGYPVWLSGKQLKSWRIDEGYRKVHFKKGLNRILYRIENGWHAAGFSLVIHTGRQQ